MRPLSYSAGSTSSPPTELAPRLSLTRRLVGMALVGLLILLIYTKDDLYAWFATNWPATKLQLLSFPLLGGLLALVQHLLHLLNRQHGVGIGVMYAASYIGLSWVILGVLIPGRTGWRWGTWLYGGMGAISLVLLLVSHFSKWPIPAHLADSLAYFLVTPMPVMVLLALQHAMRPPQPTA